MRKALVTGIAGFIASNVARQLLRAGWRVVGIDDFNDYYDPRLKWHRVRKLVAEFVSHEASCQLKEVPGGLVLEADSLTIEFGSIADGCRIHDLFEREKPDIVYNLAARAGVRQSVERPHEYVAANVTGQLNLLEAMARSGTKKLVYASTASLYAGQSLPFCEDANVDRPISPYAATKKSAELMTHAYHFLYGIDVSIVRYFTAYGPAGRPDMSITKFIKGILRQEPITVFGDGNQSRDFTYVEDIAAGTLLAEKEVGYDVFNLSGGHEPVTINEVIAMCEGIIGHKADVQYAEPFQCDIVETRALTEKAQSILGWRPKTSFEDGLRRCVEWHQANPEF